MAYLRRLADEYDITLVSFEKPEDRPAGVAVAEQLGVAGIEWVALSYHRRPPVISTVADMLRGAWALRRLARSLGGVDVVAARSDVPAFMVLLARLRAPFLFDIRGFWADERTESGAWRRGGAVDRVVRWAEDRAYARADAVVTLTRVSGPHIRPRLRSDAVPVVVIPTCADVERFATGTPRPDGPRTVWSGSIGYWYRFDLAVRMARELGRPFTVLTRQTDLASAGLDGLDADVRTVAPSDMPAELREGDIGLSLIRPGYSKIASAPTRLAEYLAAGMPVAVTPEIGDVEQLVEGGGVGVVVRDESDSSLAEAASRLTAMAADPAVRDRCRRLAREHFTVETGASEYRRVLDELYRSAASRSSSASRGVQTS